MGAHAAHDVAQDAVADGGKAAPRQPARAAAPGHPLAQVPHAAQHVCDRGLPRGLVPAGALGLRRAAVDVLAGSGGARRGAPARRAGERSPDEPLNVGIVGRPLADGQAGEHAGDGGNVRGRGAGAAEARRGAHDGGGGVGLPAISRPAFAAARPVHGPAVLMRGYGLLAPRLALAAAAAAPPVPAGAGIVLGIGAVKQRHTGRPACRAPLAWTTAAPRGAARRPCTAHRRPPRRRGPQPRGCQAPGRP